MVSLASRNLHGPRCLNMRILSSPFFFEWHQVVLINWLKSPLVVSLGWSHRPRGRLVRHEIILHQLIHDAAGGWVRLPKLVMECSMLVSRVQVRQRIDLVTKFSIYAVDNTRTAPENHKVADWQEMSHDCCCQIRCWCEWPKRLVRQAYRQWECSHAGPADSSTGPQWYRRLRRSSGVYLTKGPTHAPGSRLREFPWVPPQGTCAFIRGGSSQLPRIPRDPLSGHVTVNLKVRPGESRVSGRSNHHTLPRFIRLVWVTLSQW